MSPTVTAAMIPTYATGKTTVSGIERTAIATATVTVIAVTDLDPDHLDETAATMLETVETGIGTAMLIRAEVGRTTGRGLEETNIARGTTTRKAETGVAIGTSLPLKRQRETEARDAQHRRPEVPPRT